MLSMSMDSSSASMKFMGPSTKYMNMDLCKTGFVNRSQGIGRKIHMGEDGVEENDADNPIKPRQSSRCWYIITMPKEHPLSQSRSPSKIEPGIPPTTPTKSPQPPTTKEIKGDHHQHHRHEACYI